MKRTYKVGNLYNPLGFAAGVTAAAVRGSLQARRKYKAGLKKKTSTKTARRPRYGMKGRTGSKVVLTRRRKTFKENHSTENRSTSIQVYAKQPTAMKMAMCAMEPQWLRVQGLSQYDTSVGYYPIANRLYTPNGSHILPLHVWDITSTPNYQGSTGIIYPNAGFYMGTLSTLANADVFNTPLLSQNADGTNNAASPWVLENTSGGYDDMPKRKSFHHWTHIKANLYGVRKRSTRFVCQLIMVKDTAADFINGAGINAEKKKLVDYLIRPFIYNNLNAGDPQTAADIKILKTYEVIVAPTTLDDYGGEATSVPRIQTLNWFINHNRIRRYDWKRENVPANTQDAGFDIEIGSGHDTRVDPKYRVYFVIRALSPDRRSVTADQIAADPVSEPSYDIVIRNKFSNPT